MITNQGPILPAEISIASNMASRFASKWSLVDKEDLKSVLVLWLYENAATVARYRSEPDGPIKLVTSMRRRAHAYCTSEQQERSGTPLDYNSRYSIEQIERCLIAMFNSGSGPSVRVDPRSDTMIDKWDPSLDDARTAVLDVKLAFEKIEIDLQRILVLKYEQEFTYRDIAMLDQISAPGARKRVRKALRQIQTVLDEN
jgi:DNA-directed RNA polymerase specialized sigma24 family protein